MSFAEIVSELENKYRKICVARMSPELINDLIVRAYDSEMKLSELALINTPSARNLIIKPYDISCMDEIVASLKKNRPEFVPVIQSDVIRISANPPTEETRRKAVKEAKEILEKSKVKVRLLRKDLIDDLKKDDISEDVKKKEISRIDQEVKDMNSKLDDIFMIKEKEILTL